MRVAGQLLASCGQAREATLSIPHDQGHECRGVPCSAGGYRRLTSWVQHVAWPVVWPWGVRGQCVGRPTAWVGRRAAIEPKGGGSRAKELC